jgi:hypothetical protein
LPDVLAELIKACHTVAGESFLSLNLLKAGVELGLLQIALRTAACAAITRALQVPAACLPHSKPLLLI